MADSMLHKCRFETDREVLGIEDLEFYAARHSFASIARNDLKVDKGTVGEALNHVDKENRMTDLYIKKIFP